MTIRRARVAAAAFVLLAAAYANHFQNGFHFDDDHTIVNNVFVRDLRFVPRYFTDASTSSVLPSNRSYRPVLQTTLALDYWIAGYDPLAFQIDSFVWFVVQLLAMWWLFARVTQDDLAALLATAVYGLHPACAETVNYIIQRGDIISTCGVVVGLALYAGLPSRRRSLLYLFPVACAVLAKPPAAVFPALLFAYAVIVERQSGRDAIVESAPSLALVVGLLIWTAVHTPPTFTAGGGAARWYWLTQLFVASRYFVAFFAPVGLSADNDWRLVESISDWRVIVGVAFISALIVLAVKTGRRSHTRPIAFGVAWFLIALVPTAVVPLAEVGNDHRMFFPFVGLSLAACWTAWLAVRRATTRSAARRRAAFAIVAVILAAEAVGVHARNDVWRTDESLWYDVTVKSPTNGRGLMNYGLTRMAQGDYATATAYFERALAYTPNYSLLHINLGIVYGAVGRLVDAEREFHTAIRLAPEDWRTHYYYGRWLRETRRWDEALEQIELAARQNPADVDTARELRFLRSKASSPRVRSE